MDAEKQYVLTIDALCYPKILFSFAQVFQTEEELLAREVEQKARTIGVVPAGHL
jgi:hypothetical protein